MLDALGTSSTPVRIDSEVLIPPRSHVLSPVACRLIVMLVLRGAVWSRVTGMVSAALENGCSTFMWIGAPSRTPVLVVVAVIVTFSAARMPLLATVTCSEPDSPGSR
jgi:hypothetical protein